MRCPSCDGSKARGQYLCRRCWFTLPGPTRHALNRRDSDAGARLLQLHAQLRDNTPLTEIRIGTPT